MGTWIRCGQCGARFYEPSTAELSKEDWVKAMEVLEDKLAEHFCPEMEAAGYERPLSSHRALLEL